MSVIETIESNPRSLHPPFVVKDERFRTVESLPGIRVPSPMEMECKFNPTKNHDEREVSYDFRLRQLMITRAEYY